MAYFDGIFSGEEFLNKLLNPDADPDPDHLRGGQSHSYNTSCVKKSSQSKQVFELHVRTDKHTQMHYPRTPLRE